MSEQNPFTGSGGNLTGLARGLVSITPDDDNDLTNVIVGLTCKGAGGDVVIVTAKDQTVTYPIELGDILPVGIKRVRATDTTATGLWGFEP